MGIFLNPINEAYFGKTKDVKAIEEAVGVARKPYLGKKYNSSFYDDKNIAKVGTAIKKAFGFPEVDFNLNNDPTRNAYCYPIGTALFSVDAIKGIKVDKDGKMTTNNNTDYYCYIRCTTGLWSDENFTDKEITAILLHEIGHTVQHVTSTGLHEYSVAMLVAEFVTCVLNPTNLVMYAKADPTFRGKFNDIAKGSTLLTAFVKGGSALTGLTKCISYNLTAIISALTPGILSPAITLTNIAFDIYKNPTSALVSILMGGWHKGAEYNADTFAATFGYGADLSSALTKMELSLDKYTGTKVEKMTNSLPIIGAINDAMSIPCAILSSPFSAHPISPKRVNNIIKELESELSRSDLSPALKKSIRSDIESLKGLESKYKEIDYGKKSFTRQWFKRVMASGKTGGAISGTVGKMDLLDAAAGIAESTIDLILKKYDYINECDESYLATLI